MFTALNNQILICVFQAHFRMPIRYDVYDGPSDESDAKISPDNWCVQVAASYQISKSSSALARPRKFLN